MRDPAFINSAAFPQDKPDFSASCEIQKHARRAITQIPNPKIIATLFEGPLDPWSSRGRRLVLRSGTGAGFGVSPFEGHSRDQTMRGRPING